MYFDVFVYFRPSTTFFVFDLKFTVLKLLKPLTTTSLTYGHLSISTKTYWWRQLSSNGGNLFVHLIAYFTIGFRHNLKKSYLEYMMVKYGFIIDFKLLYSYIVSVQWYN